MPARFGETAARCPVLSPIFSGVGIPTLSSIVRSRFAIGVLFANGICHVAAALEMARRPAGQQTRQVHVVVDVAIAQPASVENHRVVEQRPVSIVRVAHPLQEVAQQLDVILVDLGFSRDQLRVVDVM